MEKVASLCTLRKYLLKVPSGKLTEILAVLVHEDVPQDSAERGFVPEGKAICGANFSSTWAGPLLKRLDVLTPNNSFIEREVSVNPLLPL
jgi:hypothetical protein